ncbi:hypothetical protein STEG23_032405, partial [Scotinomys teguina]
YLNAYNAFIDKQYLNTYNAFIDKQYLNAYNAFIHTQYLNHDPPGLVKWLVLWKDTYRISMTWCGHRTSLKNFSEDPMIMMHRNQRHLDQT